ncbi:MAG: hypothetical protein WC415_04520 [Patescibacteria group bacterium]|jgi:amino acid transporter
MKKISTICFFIFFALLLLTVPALNAHAQNLEDAFKVSDGPSTDPLDTAASRAGYNIKKEVNIYKNISDIIKFSLSFLGVIFLLLMIYGGFLWMTDQGKEEQVEKAKKIIVAAIIGIIIITSAYAISWFVINALSQKTIQGA